MDPGVIAGALSCGGAKGGKKNTSKHEVDDLYDLYIQPNKSSTKRKF